MTAAPHWETERQLPTNYDAEQAVLGAILANNEALDLIDGLEPEHFADPTHGRIFAASRALISGGQVANAVTLKNAFEKDESLKDVGGAQYLAELQGNFVSIVGAPDYAGQVTDRYRRRQVIQIAEDVMADACQTDLNRPVDKILTDVQARLEDVMAGGEERGLEALALPEALRSIDEARSRDQQGFTAGLSTGLTSLDRALCGGPKPGDLIIIGGATSMGKSALAGAVSLNAAKRGAPVGFFSLEMASDQVAQRFLAIEAGIDLGRIVQGRISEDERSALDLAAGRLKDIPLFIDEGMAVSVPDISARARRLKRAKGLALIVVDYLQLMDGTGGGNRVEELSAITRGLKKLARRLGVPVVALSQLSRTHNHRDNKRPQLSDLRESGSIEQDADKVIFCYRHAYYLEREEPSDGNKYAAWKADLEACRRVCEAIIAKQRNGPLGTVKLRFEAETTRFEDQDRQEEIPL